MDPDDRLLGYLYIDFTGKTEKNGHLVIKHEDCNKKGGLLRVKHDLESQDLGRFG